MKPSTLISVLTIIFLFIAIYVSFLNERAIKLLDLQNDALTERVTFLEGVLKDSGLASPKDQNADDMTAEDNSVNIKISPKGKDGASKEKISAFVEPDDIEVNIKYRLDDRYADYLKEPKFTGAELGEVVLNVIVDRMGDVKTAKLYKATGITNEEVIEACKKAALQTDFNYCYDDVERKKGTITYVFTQKKRNF